MRWADFVARMGKDLHTEFCWGNLRERDHLEDSGVVERIILRWIFREWDHGAWTGVIWLRIGTDACYCEHGN